MALQFNMEHTVKDLNTIALKKILKKSDFSTTAENSLLTFSAAHDSIGGLAELPALGVAQVTGPGELTPLPEPAVLADAASTRAVTVIWQRKAEGPLFKEDGIWSIYIHE